ncbi:alpha-ketoacid dehydrogenase subunit alpha/beta [Halobacterium yunchengense]|uniref:alpha-ketoacid dehydrogenase subunit alpha/beta n=1 Tax=Halobacterium yunchengense TaxID=3108497 RepID=UPI003AB8F146
MAKWTETKPGEDLYRVLAPDGSPVDDQPDVDDETLRRLYETMRLSRVYDEKMLRLQRRGEISILSRSVGEEAIPVGSVAALQAGDWCFPTYRQTPTKLYWGGSLARAVAGLMGAEPETVDEHLPVEDGPPVNFSPVYIPLASNVPNAAGSAMTDALDDGDAVTLSYIGDGSTSEGDFYEGLNFAGVFDAPAVTVVHNNQWAISVPRHRQTAADTYAQKAEAAGIPHRRVDGNDVLAVHEAAREAVERARDGGGPMLLECVTYRVDDHNTADDAGAYRDDSQLEYWRDRDPIDRLEAYLLAEGVLDEAAVEAVEADATERVEAAVERAREVPTSDPQRIFDNHLRGDSWTERHQRAELRAERHGDNPFVDYTGSWAAADDRPLAALGGSVPDGDATEVNLVTAVRDALDGELARDDSVRLLGYDVGPIGGVFRATEGLYEEYGGDRVVDTPLSENGILGAAVGMAMRGERVVPEIQFMGFFYPAFGQFMYSLAKMRERSGGAFDLPLTVRVPYGGGIKSSEYHSESTESLFVHTPGVRVVCPSSPAQAKGLLAASIRHDDPVMFLEPKAKYRTQTETVPDDPYTLPLDEPRLVREGSDVTVLTWGAMVEEAVAAADGVAADVEVLDLRTLSPLPVEAVLASVKKTGRCVVLHEARRRVGVGAELSALVNEYAVDHLEAPIKRVTGYDVHFPGHQTEDAYLPDADRARAGIEAVLSYEY